MGDKKSHNKKNLVLMALEQSGFLSQIENMTIKEVKEKLSEQGYCDFIDVLTISLLLVKLLTDKENPSTPLFKEDQETREMRFAYRYDLSKDDVTTLKAFMKHTKYESVGEVLNISGEAVSKRLKNIYRKMNVSNKFEAAQIAIHAGIVDYFT